MSSPVPRLELRQSQSLVMTQQLQQSIKLLQMSSLELAQYVEQEMEKNPLLAADEQESALEKQEEGAEEAKPEAEQEEESGEPAAADAAEGTEREWAEEEEDGEERETRYEIRSAAHDPGEEEDGFESFAAKEVTLRDYLTDQLNMEVTDPIKRIIGQHLIDLVDESGYIKEDTHVVATLLGCEQELIEETFAILHTFDPSGVCARNLPECLAIQLRDKDRLDPAMEKLLAHLDLIAKADMDALRKACGVDSEDIREMCAEIRALNPRPGIGFQHEPVEAIVPDVTLKRAKGGGWHVELNPATLPRVLVNRRYYARLSGRTRDKQEKKYLSEQLAAANWLVKALDSRAQTILKVSTEIVAQQDAFFRQGIRYLHPLTLREIAAVVGLHESTVSRVTTSKFMATPRGTYELKYFFSAAIQNATGGGDYSNKTVQYLISELIREEPANAVLSDDAIAAALAGRGVEIARRTVAKYRELMQIPSSSARRRQKAGM